MGRPIVLYERIPVPAAPAGPPGIPSQVVAADPALLAPPEAMRVEYIVYDEEAGAAATMLVRPALVEREFWPTIPMEITNYNNMLRAIGNDDCGEFWLAEPYLMRRGSKIAIEIQNRVIGLSISGTVAFHGMGVTSKRPYDLVVPFALGPGDDEGSVRQTFAGQLNAKVSGREDVLIYAMTWSRTLESPGWNPWRIGLNVKPSYGQQWATSGGTARGAGGLIPPLFIWSNIRGPLVAAFYKPLGDKDNPLVLEQGDEITFEFSSLLQGIPTNAVIGIVGTSVAK